MRAANVQMQQPLRSTLAPSPVLLRNAGERVSTGPTRRPLRHSLGVHLRARIRATLAMLTLLQSTKALAGQLARPRASLLGARFETSPIRLPHLVGGAFEAWIQTLTSVPVQIRTENSR